MPFRMSFVYLYRCKHLKVTNIQKMQFAMNIELHFLLSINEIAIIINSLLTKIVMKTIFVANNNGKMPKSYLKKLCKLANYD